MVENLLWMLAGTIFGVIVDRNWERVRSLIGEGYHGILSARRANRESTVFAEVPRLYRRMGATKELFVATEIQVVEVPMLHDRAIGIHPNAESGSAPLIVIDDAQRQQFPVDMHIVRSRLAAGAHLWDGDILYLISADMEESERGQTITRLHAGVANYFSYVTAAERWKSRVAARDVQWIAASPYRSLGELLAHPPVPLALAGVAICVFETTDGPKIPTAIRSQAVVNVMGRVGLIPTFGLESSVTAGQSSRFDPLTFNFLKEFLEEMFGDEGLIRNAESEGLDPDSIFDTPAGLELVTELDSGRLSLLVTGVVGELTDGTITVCMQANFSDDAYYRRVRKHAKSNWEWGPARGGRASLEFRDRDDFLGESGALLAPTLAPSSFVAADLAARGWKSN